MFVPILTYHMVQPRFDLGITHVTPKRFEQQIKYLFDSGYKTISLNDYIDQNYDNNNKTIIITFDDAYSSVYEYAFPILKKYNFIATIFVITSYVGNWNIWDYNFLRCKFLHCTWEQLRNLISAGWEIGSHTATHRNLKALSDSEIWHEVNNSKGLIENQIQRNINIISYPFGKYNQRILEFVKEAGYEGGCTLGQNYPENQEFPYALFRRGVYSLEPFSLFKAKLENNIWSHYDDIKQKLIAFCSQGSILIRYIKTV
ncbi:MAG: polysaccharide deacetylase family protein [bacterium]